jgi:hypothetical protein
MEPAKTNPSQAIGDDSRPPTPAQFSLRSLLLLTTIVSIGLAIGVHFGGVMVVVVAAGLILADTLLSADWLIRPQNRRALAFVTASSWIIVGSGLFIGALHSIATGALARHDDWGWFFAGFLIVAAVASFYIASIRWRKLAAQTVATRDSGSMQEKMK